MIHFGSPEEQQAFLEAHDALVKSVDAMYQFTLSLEERIKAIESFLNL